MKTYSSQFLTSSICELGIELMWRGVFVKSLKMRTRSNCLSPYWTRSREAISISDNVTTRNGGSVRWTKHSVVGCKRALMRNGTPSNDSSRKGMSTSNVSPSYSEDQGRRRCLRLRKLTDVEAASAIFSANAFTSRLNIALRFLSCCSISISSSSP